MESIDFSFIINSLSFYRVFTTTAVTKVTTRADKANQYIE